jgi:hypothetical protein
MLTTISEMAASFMADLPVDDDLLAPSRHEDKLTRRNSATIYIKVLQHLFPFTAHLRVEFARAARQARTYRVHCPRKQVER